MNGPVGIVPAAGFARRLQPLSCSKEVYPIGGRPVMDYLLDRMNVAGCAEIRVVTRSEKRDVADHARACGATVLLARPASVADSLLAGLEGLGPDVPVVFGFPDTVWEPRDGFSRLLAALQPGLAVTLGIFRVEDPWRSDVVTLEGDLVTTIDVKPTQPSSSLAWGCAAASAAVLGGLEGRTEPGDYFDDLARQRLVGAVRLSNYFVDIGTPESLRRAGVVAGAGENDRIAGGLSGGAVE
jgi:NDP-sugar pyrophosphorylase family protein